MTPITHIFWDFWGTVATFTNKKVLYTRQLSKIYKVSKQELSPALTLPIGKFRIGKITEKIFFEMLAKNLAVPVPSASTKMFHIPIQTCAKPYKSVIRLVKEIQELGYPCIVLSDDNKPRSTNVKNIGRYNQFDEILISCNIGISKYDDVKKGTDKIRNYVLKKYKLDPKNILFVDDNEGNCICAKRMGIRTVQAKDPRQTIRDVKKILKIK